MTEEEFLRISGYLKANYGIDMSSKKEILTGRLDNYVKSGGWTSYSQYFNTVLGDYTGKLMNDLIGMISTNHTYFMREPEHFEFFRREVLPWIQEKEANSKDMRIWCGACSSGEEPYTLGMIVQEFLGLSANEWDATILATDLSAEVLQKARAGIYTAEQTAAIPERWKRRFMVPVENGERYVMSDALKSKIIFRQFNLMDMFPFKKKMQVIFLRNVMIYFDKATKEKLVRKLYDLLEPGGYLFIGRTETIDRTELPFELVEPAVFKRM